VKTRHARESIKSFAPPGLEPGVIFEYSYQEGHERITPLWVLNFQRDVPVRLKRYRLKPYAAPGYNLRNVAFNLPPFNPTPDASGFYTFEAKNLKAWKDEPFQFPEIQLRASAVIYYNPVEGSMTAEAYWAKVCGRLQAQTDATAKPTKAVRAALEKIVAASDTPDAKLHKIYDFVRTKLANQDLDVAGYTWEQRQKLPRNDDAGETLARGRGTGDDLVAAFVALARAASFDARLAQTNDRTFILYNDQMREPFVFRKLVAAVRTGETWTFFDPSARYLPFGILDWRFSGTAALVGDRKQALLPRVALPNAAASVRSRKGVFTLDEQGTLEGRVTVTGTGYFDVAAKNRYDALSAEERAKQLQDEVQKQFPLAELSEITFEHAADPLQPLVLSYQLRLPGFAERTGARLFFQPAVLYKGLQPMFEAPERRGAILFHYLYREADTFEIAVPVAFKLEAGNAPPPLDFGKSGRYDVKVAYTPKSGQITYEREFEFFNAAIASKFYPAVKRLMEEVNERDNHTLTFRVPAEIVTPDSPATAEEKTP
jgi:hypothetical protein